MATAIQELPEPKTTRLTVLAMNCQTVHGCNSTAKAFIDDIRLIFGL